MVIAFRINNNQNFQKAYPCHFNFLFFYLPNFVSLEHDFVLSEHHNFVSTEHPQFCYSIKIPKIYLEIPPGKNCLDPRMIHQKILEYYDIYHSLAEPAEVS